MKTRWGPNGRCGDKCSDKGCGNRDGIETGIIPEIGAIGTEDGIETGITPDGVETREDSAKQEVIDCDICEQMIDNVRIDVKKS